MHRRATDAGALLRRLGLIPVVILGVLSTLATGGGGGGGNGTNAGTIQFVQSSFDAPEGTVVNILVNRSGGSDGAASVDYASADGTAMSGSDYDAAAGTLTWPDGVSGNRTISIPITDDGSMEASESFTVTLTNASVATIGPNSTATVNIIDNEPGQIGLSWDQGNWDEVTWQ